MAKQRIWLRRIVSVVAVATTLMLAAPLASQAETAAKAPACACSISLSAASGHGGTSVTVKGAHFTAGGHVKIHFVDAHGTRKLVEENVKVAMDGKFSVKVTVPSTAALGAGRFVAKENGHAGRAVAKFTVT
jgi:hypothetical protein